MVADSGAEVDRLKRCVKRLVDVIEAVLPKVEKLICARDGFRWDEWWNLDRACMNARGLLGQEQAHG